MSQRRGGLTPRSRGYTHTHSLSLSFSHPFRGESPFSLASSRRRRRRFDCSPACSGFLVFLPLFFLPFLPLFFSRFSPPSPFSCTPPPGRFNGQPAWRPRPRSWFFVLLAEQTWPRLFRPRQRSVSNARCYWRHETVIVVPRRGLREDDWVYSEWHVEVGETLLFFFFLASVANFFVEIELCLLFDNRHVEFWSFGRNAMGEDPGQNVNIV